MLLLIHLFSRSSMRIGCCFEYICVEKVNIDVSCSYSLLSTLHSINLWSCLPSLVFAWGQAESKLGGVDTFHFASLFFIIIYLYSLINFVLGYFTYVILPFFCMFCIFGRFICQSSESARKVPIKTPDVRSSENSRKIQEILFSEISHGVKRAHGGETAGADRKSVV